MSSLLKRVFIGHRGVGKSSLLKRHQSFFSEITHFDLDHEIEKATQMGISEFFNLNGEKKFREIEKNVFIKLLEHKSYVIALGAGFDVSLIPADCEVIYVSRRTDSDGRIFLNRPRLNPELSPLDEYQRRYQQRQANFRKRANFIYHLPEGFQGHCAISQGIEKSILTLTFRSDFKIQNAFITLIPKKESLLQFFNSIELRTDLFSDAHIKKIISENPQKYFLISYRKKAASFEHTAGLIDWALELGEVPPVLLNNQQLIVSNHDDTLEVAVAKFKNYSNFQQKLCPVISSWRELIQGHHWQQENPRRRSFLPRTPKDQSKSLWRWYRELQFSKQKINFIQMFQDFDDQPSLFEYLKAVSFSSQHREHESLTKASEESHFFAVLGYPVHHSWTPITQMEKTKKNVLAIPLQEDDFSLAVDFLNKLGLKAAAVTSPLKNLAGELAKKGQPCNTLVFYKDSVRGTSTDEEGFQKLLKAFERKSLLNLKDQKIVIWGGGGVLDSLKSYLPKASFYSAQTAMPRADQMPVESPDVIIWSAPRKSGIQMPPVPWRPSWVIDANYAENSLGLEYAQKAGCHYISGADMFYGQAEAQAGFWSAHKK